MKQTIEAVIQKHYQVMPRTITALGGGFYGRVYVVQMAMPPHEIVIKLYLFPGLAEKEAAQLKILAAHALVKMPEVYFTHIKDNDTAYDVLAMEYIPGKNAGTSGLTLSEKNRASIASTIVDNLHAYHQTIHQKGFGKIDGDAFQPDWKTYYRPEAEASFAKAKQLYEENKLDYDVLSVMDKAIESFDKIFYIPIREARLIHGDYNTWNILLDEDLSCVKAVIDPFNSCWGDSELDLYQLNNANGRDYDLLGLYASRYKLSENFELKSSFYELFTEVAHYFDADVDVKKSNIAQESQQLKQVMRSYGLMN